MNLILIRFWVLIRHEINNFPQSGMMTIPYYGYIIAFSTPLSIIQRRISRVFFIIRNAFPKFTREVRLAEIFQIVVQKVTFKITPSLSSNNQKFVLKFRCSWWDCEYPCPAIFRVTRRNLHLRILYSDEIRERHF